MLKDYLRHKWGLTGVVIARGVPIEKLKVKGVLIGGKKYQKVFLVGKGDRELFKTS